MKKIVRSGITAVFVLLVSAAVVAGDHSPSVQQALDLQADARVANAERIPILLVVTREDCTYCEKLKHHILVPMLRNSVYRSRVIIRELRIDPDVRLRDFAGKEVLASAFAETYAATWTPTVLLLNESGQEIAERMIGINTIEFYGYYLDRAIDLALERMKPPG